MMTIAEIYKKFVTPPNLQQHLLTVTKIALYIAQNFKNGEVNIDILKVAALLHDLANIVKFDFAKHPEFLGDAQKNIGYWIEQQKSIIEKYGKDDHEATDKMLNEIGVTDAIKNIISLKSFGNAVEVSNSNNLEAKILLYADLRVGPFGIVSLQERIDDLTTRLEKYRNRPDLPDLISACSNIEKLVSVGELSERDLLNNDEELLNSVV